MQENPTYNQPEAEEEGIDIIALLKDLWNGRRTILITTAVCFALGLVAALTLKRTYTVKSVMAPQMNFARNYALASLASVSGFDLGTSSSSSAELSPLIYPHIVNSTTFRLELMHAPLHYEKVDTAISMFDYQRNYATPSKMSKVLGTVRKYTIGLPGLLLGKLDKDEFAGKEEVVAPSQTPDDGSVKPIRLSRAEQSMLGKIAASVVLSVERKEGYLTLSVTGSEPLQTAELAIKAQELLQAEITRFRTEKAQEQLDYLQERYNEVKAETEAYQIALAAITDRTQNMATTRGRVERDRLQTKFAMSNAIFTEMTKQMEQAKMQVKRETPLLAIVQPITVPLQASNSRSRTLLVWTFLGFILGCGIVLGLQYLPKLKEMFASAPEKKEDAE